MMTFCAISGLPVVGSEDEYGIIQVDWHILATGDTPATALAAGKSRIGGEQAIAIPGDREGFYAETLRGNLRVIRRRELKYYGIDPACALPAGAAHTDD